MYGLFEVEHTLCKRCVHKEWHVAAGGIHKCKVRDKYRSGFPDGGSAALETSRLEVPQAASF